MPTLSSTCPLCDHPVLVGAYSILEQGEMAHLKCPPSSANRWPEGVRQLLCLSCGRMFASESKSHRLCRLCG